MRTKKSDLHVHLLQSLFPEDIYDLAEAHYMDINWDRFGFLDRYEKVIGTRLDPTQMFEKEAKAECVSEIEDAMVFPSAETGCFDKFDIRCFFPICVAGYYLDQQLHSQIVKMVTDRHKKEGLSYVEYRQAVGYSSEEKDEWKEWHRLFIQSLKDASSDTFQAKYIMRITDSMYGAVREFMAENPNIMDTFIGLDFTGRELPAKSHKAFFKSLHKDNASNPAKSLDVVAHVGEVFFDKSIESAIRWCHEYAELGVKRMAHCIALGLDPEIALQRDQGAHTQETAAERIDQIEYDLKHYAQLTEYGVVIDKNKLDKEKLGLEKENSEEIVISAYDEKRIRELRLRQDYVLNVIKEKGIVIELCPTSNMLIGGISRIEHHPFRKFYHGGHKIAICTDDPGILNTTLADEVDLILKSFNMKEEEIDEQVGDAFKYRLGASRVSNES